MVEDHGDRRRASWEGEEERMKAYLRALRFPFLTGSLMPVVLTGVWAAAHGSFSWGPFVLVLAGVAFLHVGANLINDWADSTGSDPVNRQVTPFSGGSRAIQDHGLSRRTMLVMALACYGAGLAVGVILILKQPLVALLGGLGVAVGLLYSVRPFNFMSRGLGEASIFLAFGPLVTLGTWYVLTDELSWGAFVLGVPLGLLTTAIIWINQFPDFRADRATGKRNLVVRMKPASARWVYPLLMAGAFLSLFGLVAVGFPPLLLIGLGAAPLAYKACRGFFQHYDRHPGIVPAQALTIQTQLAMGLLTSLGLALTIWLG